jgi:Abortive infection alpha
MSEPGYDSGPDTPLEAVGGLARLAAGAWVRSASWGLGASIRMARAATDPRQAFELVQEFGDGVRGYAREVLGVSDLDRRVAQLMPAAEDVENGAVPDDDALRAAGAELLRRSTDVDSLEPAHPAFARILEELAPDEARILRLMATEGSQAAVDVRSTHLMGIGSQVIAEGLTMIGQRAGCRNVDRAPSYLNNLNRLGLVWFSKEPVEDPIAYQVLEAQPDVLAALKSAPRTKTVQRSIHLTPFGRDFCQAALPVQTAEIDALEEEPEGSAP